MATTRSGPTRLDWLSLRKSVWLPGKDIKNVEVKIVYAALITKFNNIDDTLSPIIKPARWNLSALVDSVGFGQNERKQCTH